VKARQVVSFHTARSLPSTHATYSLHPSPSLWNTSDLVYLHIRHRHGCSVVTHKA
jgi:hypothetical protein